MCLHLSPSQLPEASLLSCFGKELFPILLITLQDFFAFTSLCPISCPTTFFKHWHRRRGSIFIYKFFDFQLIKKWRFSFLLRVLFMKDITKYTDFSNICGFFVVGLNSSQLKSKQILWKKKQLLKQLEVFATFKCN